MTHVARCLEVLRLQLNAMAPGRDKTSDGGIGDKRHQALGSKSDHNPWWNDTVTARDFDHDPANGLDCHKLAAALIASRDRRIKYIIWYGRIWKARTGAWETYRGSNPHTGHLHLSVVASAACESATQWTLPGFTRPTTGRILELKTPRMSGADVRRVQAVLRAWYGLPAAWVDGYYGPGVADYVKRAQRGVPPQPVLKDDGVVGPMTLRKLGLA